MKIQKFINLCLLAKKILIKNKYSINILAIRQLHLMRPHPVLLKEYYQSKKIIDTKIDGKNILTRIFNLMKDYLLDSSEFYGDKIFKKKETKQIKCLFLSHLINETHLKNKDDFYYGALPRYLEKKNYHSLLILRNLTNQNSNLIYEKNKKFLKNKILLSKSVNFIKELKLILIIFKTYISLIKLKKIDKDVKKFFIDKNLLKFAGSTYNNLKLLMQVEYIVKKYQPNYFFLTYEGHAWEKLIINQIKKKFPNIKLCAYQFSIVTKYSSSIYLDIGKEFNPDFILTSGNYTKKKFIKKNKRDTICLNIGSNKFIKKIKSNKNSKNILILPEGFNSETINMMRFTIAAAIRFKDKKFVFRFHPMINKSQFFKIHLLDNLKIPKNLIISNNLFDEDLKNSKYVIYRGSAAAIQALASSKIVIYLKFSNEINIDPLYMLNNKFSVKKTYELNKIFKDKKIMKKNILNTKFTSEYFDKPNFNSLIKLLN